jgi:type II pantothenate kinase
MPVLCTLKHPDDYLVSDWDIGADPWDRAHWIGLFVSFPRWIEPLLRQDPEQAGRDFETRWAEFLTEWDAGLAEIREQADAGVRLMTVDLTSFRNRKLRKYGWLDPYRQIKARENALAVELYPSVVRRIDAAAPSDRWELLIRGVFAGNIFDMGSAKTIEMYHKGQLDFNTTLERAPRRPWFIDHADALIPRLAARACYRQALIFVDNAGADIGLGVIPLAREMARAGTRVVLAANDSPTLNDITVTELRPLLAQLADHDPTLARLCRDGLIAAVGSGGDIPLIDLGQVSDECNAEAARSDLLVLEGMGRGVESNWDREFTCDVWRVALLKDEAVVRHHGAAMFDAVCRFQPA